MPLLEATKATFARKIELTVLLALFFATLPAFFRGELWTLIAMPLAYWVIGVNIFHDGSHFALSRDWRINALATYWGWYFSSPFEWYHQHVIGHHVYANIPTKVRPRLPPWRNEGGTGQGQNSHSRRALFLPFFCTGPRPVPQRLHAAPLHDRAVAPGAQAPGQDVLVVGHEKEDEKKCLFF